MNRISIAAAIGGVLAAVTLGFAGPASAHTGTAGTGPAHVGAELPIAPVGGSQTGRIGLELPIAPVGAAGSGRVAMTPLNASDPGSYHSVMQSGAELPIAPVG
ncbi:hypothetical protein BayCH28_02895 [Mycolicibacterium sp. CH28]|uniref:hypothetical protein n=1 Tax=Mycolicibacterium sp. CH28 TaxID=2512237 RepID=UPI001081AFDA|nr:hypothetical protein [Mycolicibacterium sp. CH28]TGD90792.1 hypothetical protein BayCH28_02895 [Mycolicibacterium sp. CH28]